PTTWAGSNYVKSDECFDRCPAAGCGRCWRFWVCICEYTHCGRGTAFQHPCFRENVACPHSVRAARRSSVATLHSRNAVPRSCSAILRWKRRVLHSSLAVLHCWFAALQLSIAAFHACTRALLQ